MLINKKVTKKSLLTTCLSLVIFLQAHAAEIVDVAPLTNRIIIIHFDDGKVVYPNNLTVNRLDLASALKINNYIISSPDDATYAGGLKPNEIGRKSKGTEFIASPPWNDSKKSFNPTDKPWASEHWIYLVLPENLQEGASYVINTGNLASNGSSWQFTYNERKLRSEAVHVNTLGYATDAPKYGYVYHWMGDLDSLDLSSYNKNKFWIYSSDGSEILKQGTIRLRAYATNTETGRIKDSPYGNFLGSQVYEADFSDLDTPGEYKLVVEGIGSSFPFKIGADPVWEAYYRTARAIYHQRSGIRIAEPYAETNFVRPINQNTKLTDSAGTSFAGKLLYSEYPYTSWENDNDGGSSKPAIRAAAEGNTLDVAGWYHDAGDWDAYYTHQRVPILLMLTYEYLPTRFGDDELNIPESGNGIPDLIDEAAWLIKFNYRLRKELMAKGYSTGGIGGARICADVFKGVGDNGTPEHDGLPSWQETRKTVVTEADAFMTYLYAGQAAQLAIILKKLGKNPHEYPVEMLDAINFDQMSYDTVDLQKESEMAYAWASDPTNQPESSDNYADPLAHYRSYAAVNLYRLTDSEKYHKQAKKDLKTVTETAVLSQDQRWAPYSYLLADNYSLDLKVKTALKHTAMTTADELGVKSANKRAMRWGGLFSFPMLVGHSSTPAVFETIIAYAISGNVAYKYVVHTTADYFLGTNPLHTTWMTGVGPRPVKSGFNLDARHIGDNWQVFPGWIPYGPWTMEHSYDPVTYTIDGQEMKGGKGPWNQHWVHFSAYPAIEQWPGHERWFENIHAPMSAENTVHQNSVYAALTYGVVNSREYNNEEAERKVKHISTNFSDVTFNSKHEQSLIRIDFDIDDPTFGQVAFVSSNPNVAHVDQFGRITAMGKGKAAITIRSLDGSVSTVVQVDASSLTAK